MAPPIYFAKTRLSYPLYACDFDPHNSTKLAVGGGGGTSKTGVGNKLTLLDVCRKDQLNIAAEITLPEDEDNPTSLAFGHDLRIYAGINSNPKEVQEGKNMHFRVFEIQEIGNKGKSEIRISEKSKNALFSGVEKDVYQRKTRLARPLSGQIQLGAVSTGLAKESEIVLFETSPYDASKVCDVVQSSREAMDIDLIQTGEKKYQLLYTDEHAVYVKMISIDTKTENAECIYLNTVPLNRGLSERSNIRALRWLTKDHFLLLANFYGKGGVLLKIISAPPGWKGQGQLVQKLRLPSHLAKATGLSVANLNPPLKPDEPQDHTQFIIAVAGHDRSIYLYKVDLENRRKYTFISEFIHIRTFKNVHPLQITDITFSSSHTALSGPAPASSKALRLASVAISNTVVVHTLPLTSIPLPARPGKDKTSRYVINSASWTITEIYAVIISIVVVLLTSIFIQVLFEIRGAMPTYLGARELVPLEWQEALGRHIPTISTTIAPPEQTMKVLFDEFDEDDEEIIYP